MWQLPFVAAMYWLWLQTTAELEAKKNFHISQIISGIREGQKVTHSTASSLTPGKRLPLGESRLARAQYTEILKETFSQVTPAPLRCYKEWGKKIYLCWVKSPSWVIMGLSATGDLFNKYLLISFLPLTILPMSLLPWCSISSPVSKDHKFYLFSLHHLISAIPLLL